MHYEDIIHYTDIACRWALMPRFEWKGRKSPRAEETWIQKIFFIAAAINLSYYNVSFTVYAYQLDPETTDPLIYTGKISEAGSMLGFVVLGTLNMFSLLILRPQIENVLAELQDLFNQKLKNTSSVGYRLKKSIRLMRNCTVLFAFGNTYYNVMPFINMAYQILTDSKQVSYIIQNDAWYPWKIGDSIPGLCALYISQALSSILNVGTIITNQLLIHVCTIQLELHFDGLSNQLENLDAKDLRAKGILISLICYHQRIMQLADSINGIFNFTFLISLTTSTIAVCSMSFTLTTLDMMTALKYTSDKVLPAAFYNNWYEGDLAYRKMLLILMMRATKPYVWRTYKLAPVSITTYMATLKFSYQMFTCVRSLK
nr:putative odorant receptor 69a isoform X5 [Drosophila suzukii]